MYNYEIERKINDKADRWELRDLNSEIRSLKIKVDELEKQIGYLQSNNEIISTTFGTLLDMIAKHPNLSDLRGEIDDLKQNLPY